MRRLWGLLLLAASVVVAVGVLGASGVAQTNATPGSASLNDPLYPWMGNGGYDAQDYDLKLKFSSDHRSITATSTMTALATQDLSAFHLDFGSLTIDAVRVNGKAAMYVHQDPELIVKTSISKGQTFTVTVVYHGKPNSKIVAKTLPFMNPPWYVINSSDEGMIFVAEPSLAMTFMPINDHLADKATFTVALTTKADTMGVSNGVLVADSSNAEERTRVYRINQPTTSYMLLLAVAKFELVEDGSVNGVRIRHYFAPGTSRTVLDAAKRLPGILRFFNEKLGLFPFPEIGVVTVGTNSGWALENQGLMFFRKNGLEPGWLAETLAHETLHQWFAAAVTATDYSQMFVHEGITEYLGWYWTQQDHSPGHVAERIKNLYPKIVAGCHTTWDFGKEEYLRYLKDRYGPEITIPKEKLEQFLKLLFGNSLPPEIHQRLLELGKEKGLDGVAVIHDQIKTLEFSRATITACNDAELLEIVGRKSEYDLEQERYLPPGRIRFGDNPFNAGTYYRGATAMFVLHQKLSDDTFFGVLREFLKRHRFGNASVQDFVNTVAELGDAPTTAEFEHWLYDERVPDLPALGLRASDVKVGLVFGP